MVFKMFDKNNINEDFERDPYFREFNHGPSPRTPYHPPPHTRRRSFRPPPPPMPPIPVSREDFKELKHFFILSIIIDKEEGINGYQLQEHYNIPRGSMLRSLEELENGEYLKVTETKVEGRDQKIYSISEKGKQYLEHLKEKWANEFATMSDMAPPEVYAHPFTRRPHRVKMMRFIEHCESKEEALDYFRGMRSKLTLSIKRLNFRIENITQIKEELDSVISNIEKMDGLDKKKVKDLVKDVNIKKRHL
ncbi:MAG: PadR family transcriptional regulator [Promethearchaeota archaeon]|nr:MAG: PadR family transcriptional regulator [Candidatus Lokiarchaeota archaeon]